MRQQVVERQARHATLAPILGATSDGRATAESARALMITVLGEFVRPNGGGAWTQTLIDTMELLGVGSKATRQVLARLADNDWLDRTRDGRRTRWHLTERASTLLDEGAARIYGFGRSPRKWNGRWLVLLASIPEGDGNPRYRLKVGLTWAGFGSLGQGTWISPWVDRETDAMSALDGLDVPGATTFVAEVGQLGSGRDLAERAWDLRAVRAEYLGFLATSTRHERPGSDIAVNELTMLVHRWRRFPFLDPDLPAALLPADWPGSDAVDRFATRRAELLGAATEWWISADARYGGA